MRSIWSGSIGFGLVTIPVKMYAATEESTIAFETLDKKNNAKIRYKKVNDATGEEVKPQDIIKAYKKGGSYVLLEEADFEKATPGKIDHLELLEFVKEKEIDSIYFEKPYYLAPDKVGVKAYVLLREALKKEGKAALGKMVYHKKEWIALIKPMGDFLILNRIRFFEEIKPASELPAVAATIKAEELKMAQTLINQLSGSFEPEKYRDEYSDKLIQMIEAKAKGKDKSVKALKVVHSNKTEDLMQQLKASLKTKKAS